MRILNNQRGFSAFEAVLIVIILGLVGYLGYQAYIDHQSPNQDNTTTSAKKADPYAGWLTFRSSEDKLSIRYPKDWTLVDKKAGPDDPFMESITLTSPNGFELDTTVDPSGLGGACPGCTATISKLQAVPAITSDIVYLAEVTTQGPEIGGSGMKEIGLISAKGINLPASQIKLGSMGNAFIGWPTYINPDGKGVWTHTSAAQDGSANSQTPAEFFARPDVVTAEKILKSFSYK